eukprot:scaffold113955_cov28-Attheya_sp.AAC.2
MVKRLGGQKQKMIFGMDCGFLWGSCGSCAGSPERRSGVVSIAFVPNFHISDFGVVAWVPNFVVEVGSLAGCVIVIACCVLAFGGEGSASIARAGVVYRARRKIAEGGYRSNGRTSAVGSILAEGR